MFPLRSVSLSELDARLRACSDGLRSRSDSAGNGYLSAFQVRRERMWAALALAVVSFITLVTDGT